MTLQSCIRHAKRTMAVAVLCAAGFFGLSALHSPASAMASAKHPTAIKAHCGMHLGDLVLRNKIHNEFKVRIGVRNGTKGGTHMCHGFYHKKGTQANSIHFDWTPFSFPKFNWHGILDVGITSLVTTGACASFAGTLAAEPFTLGADTPITIAAGVGCTKGNQMLVHDFNPTFPIIR